VSLYTQLQTAKSEEDVKDAYIKALGLKGVTKGLIDIQTQEIWFEAKDTGRTSSYAMIGREFSGVGEEDYALVFFADIMHDGTVSTHANLPAELMHKSGDTAPVNFTPFESAHQALTDKLRPQVFSLGFLR
jgi:hypothetical protein